MLNKNRYQGTEIRCQERDIVVNDIAIYGHVYTNDVYFETKNDRIEKKYIFHNCSKLSQTSDETWKKIPLQWYVVCFVRWKLPLR